MALPRFLPIVFIIPALVGMPTAQAHSTSATITMTADGFSPRELTVDSSTTIMFVNNDAVSRWPASNPHPTHDLYPEFDPSHAITPGQWWTFKPTKVGTWHYHDHLNPHRQGTLIVTAEQGTAIDTVTPTSSATQSQKISVWERGAQTLSAFWQAITAIFVQHLPAKKETALSPDAFRTLPEKQQYAAIQKMANTRGLPNTWQYIKNAFLNDTTPASGQAHNAAHFMGSLIYKKVGLAGLAICDPTFAFGCYHGFTEGAFENNLDALIPVAKACETLGPVHSGPWSSCIHGIGHGIASYFNTTELEPALATCDTLTEGATYCHDGVFMEFASSAPDSFYQSNHPLHPCDTLAEKYQSACGRNIIAAASKRFHLPPLHIAKACLAAKAPFTTSCIDTFGFMAASTSHQDGTRIYAECQQLADSPAISQCAGAAAGELAFQNYPNWPQQAPKICQALPAPDQASCFARLNQTITNYHR